jgi:glycosidase
MRETTRRWIGAAAGALALWAGAAGGSGAPTEGALHVPSPDWRDQVVYFVMLDRFDDGDPGNNDQGGGEYDPADRARYSGGDLAGVRRRLDYIAGLGASAVWITPPVAHQWWNQATRYGGYHGYWAQDFSRVDPHFGTLADYQGLSRALHGRGMYLVQDVVVNHVANYTGYSGGWDARDPAAHFVVHPAQGPRAPTQYPFSLNDARDPAQRQAAIYHWTPDIRDFAQRTQELDWQLAGLDDLNTENPVVRAALRESYARWIREVGVDAFRVDTAYHVPAAFFEDFMHAADPALPGMAAAAATTGRRDFLAFGEGFGADKPFQEINARKLETYVRGDGGQARLGSMINFPLYGTLGDVFARGRPTAELAHRIESVMRVHARPHLMPTFVDNHDVDRFLAGGNEAGLRQALLAIMTLPGIPTLYYGTEQGFTAQRGAMFAGGVDSGGRDHFDPQAPLYRYLQRAIALRRGDVLYSRGAPTVLSHNAAAAGVIAWRIDHEGQSAFVAFNTADTPALLDNLATGLPAGTRLSEAFAIEGQAPSLTVDAAGQASVALPPRAGYVWRPQGVAAIARAVSSPELQPGPTRAEADFVLAGRAAPGATPVLVVDGDLARAVAITPAGDGRFQARVDTRDMLDPATLHCAVAWDAAQAAASARHCFNVSRPWVAAFEHADPRGDDRGPRGAYAYPLDPAWSQAHPADLLGVRAWTSGGALKLEARMASLSRTWNPALGFDHVAFTVFIELPGREGGARVMPQQNATLPGDMRWHYRLRAHGWSNTLHAWPRASASEEGTSVTPTARIEADAQAGTVTFTLPARALGDPATLSGARIYVSTWDFDGGFRALAPQAGPHAFGGGAPGDPRVMDDSGVLLVPRQVSLKPR